MKINPTLKPDITQEITYLKGEFSLWKYSIPYYSSVVPLSFVAKRFSLVDEIPDSETIEWSVEELFQRDISWDRIDNELVKYLRNDSRPQFFNALTIALLPKEGHGFSGEYISHSIIPKMDDEGLEEPIQVGDIQIQSYEGSAGLAGKMRWDVNRTIAVAVDGQHRLAAIKQLTGMISPEKLDESTVPVIFLIPDEKVGYVEPKSKTSEKSVIKSLRRVFIDLNKNARQVARARNILLDDLDVVSVCTRSLISERLSESEETGRIPLSLIDWMSEKNKFDTGPFMSTVLVLHDIVEQALAWNKIKDREPDEENDKRIKGWLRDRMGVDGADLDELMSQVNRCYNQEVPLTFLPSHISILVDYFNKNWKENIYKIFKQLKPYSDLWEYNKKHGFMRPEMVNLYIADEVMEGEYYEKKALKIENKIKLKDEDWNKKNKYTKVLEHIDQKIKGDSWAFKVVFQKAIFDSYLDLISQSSVFFEETLPLSEEKSKFTEVWISAINDLLDSNLGKRDAQFGSPKERFWSGIGLRSDSTVDHTQASVKRISKWLTAWVCMRELSVELPTFDKLSESDYVFAGIINRTLSLGLVKDGVRKIVNAIFVGVDETEYELELEVDSMIKRKYMHLRKLAKDMAS